MQEAKNIRPHFNMFIDLMEKRFMPLMAKVASIARDSGQPAEFIERHMGMYIVACV